MVHGANDPTTDCKGHIHDSRVDGSVESVRRRQRPHESASGKAPTPGYVDTPVGNVVFAADAGIRGRLCIERPSVEHNAPSSGPEHANDEVEVDHGSTEAQADVSEGEVGGG